MDARIDSEKTINGIQYWDLYVNADGEIPMLSVENEQAQQAAVAVYLFKDSTPQLAGSGQYVDWLGYFTGTISFGELDAQIRTALNNAGRSEYAPSYSIENNNMKLLITK